MSSPGNDQVFNRRNNERIRELLATILAQEVSDPRLEMVTVMSVDTAPDTRSALVYVSADPQRYDQVLEGLQSARGRIQSVLGRSLGWKYTPELRFRIDCSLDEAAQIEAALRQSSLASRSGAGPGRGDEQDAEQS